MTAYILPQDLMNLGYSPMPSLQISEFICESASRIADNFCLQSLGRVTNSEIIHVNRTKSGLYNKIFTDFLPIVSVNYIYNYYSLNNYNVVDPSNYVIDNKQGCVLINQQYSERMLINYASGYDVLPNDAWNAVLLIAASLLSDTRMRSQTDFEGVKSIQDNLMKMDFYSSNGEDTINPSAKKLLMKYKKVRSI